MGPFPGVLAVAVHSTGMLGKFYAEAFENARRGPVEALDSVGATWWQRVRFAVLTQVAPDLARDTLFRFELNFPRFVDLGSRWRRRHRLLHPTLYPRLPI